MTPASDRTRLGEGGPLTGTCSCIPAERTSACWPTDRVFPFEQIAEAFAYLEQGHAKGKVVQM